MEPPPNLIATALTHRI